MKTITWILVFVTVVLVLIGAISFSTFGWWLLIIAAASLVASIISGLFAWRR